MSEIDITKCQIADVLDGGASYIEEHGWTQGMLEDRETGAVCALGALWRASVGTNHDRDDYVSWTDPRRMTYNAATNALNSHIDEVYLAFSSVAQWNDFKGRKTPHSVTSTMRKLAKSLRTEAGNCE